MCERLRESEREDEEDDEDGCTSGTSICSSPSWFLCQKAGHCLSRWRILSCLGCLRFGRLSATAFPALSLLRRLGLVRPSTA
jgi:hypothetical protein